ncbi:SMU1112c/YaeR family gloxylase I-like metalloprotein [Aeromonas encheleia]|uniref:VOC family protein n=1 Tax=Aeromonas encheleia TaxID=73010 RepID=A0AAE9SBI7_9GAMM|nr:VOC family protein [Aeromonas encheleia]USV56978.1 VOC family protein [Aeromonas encheleia]
MTVSLFDGIHHLAIIASDYGRSRHFYHEVLGLPIINETLREERHSWKLDLALPDGSQLELFSFPAPPARPSRPEACGLRHLAFRVQALEPVIAHLQRHQIAVEPVRVDELTGSRFTFFADPDGLPLELYEVDAGPA